MDFFQGTGGRGKKISLGGASSARRTDVVARARAERQKRQGARAAQIGARGIQTLWRGEKARRSQRAARGGAWERQMEDVGKVRKMLRARGRAFVAPVPLLRKMLGTFAFFFDAAHPRAELHAAAMLELVHESVAGAASPETHICSSLLSGGGGGGAYVHLMGTLLRGCLACVEAVAATDADRAAPLCARTCDVFTRATDVDAWPRRSASPMGSEAARTARERCRRVLRQPRIFSLLRRYALRPKHVTLARALQRLTFSAIAPAAEGKGDPTASDALLRSVGNALLEAEPVAPSPLADDERAADAAFTRWTALVLAPLMEGAGEDEGQTPTTAAAAAATGGSSSSSVVRAPRRWSRLLHAMAATTATTPAASGERPSGSGAAAAQAWRAANLLQLVVATPSLCVATPADARAVLTIALRVFTALPAATRDAVQWGDRRASSRDVDRDFDRDRDRDRRRRAAHDLEVSDGSDDGGVEDEESSTPMQKRARRVVAAAAAESDPAEVWRQRVLVRRLRLVGSPAFIDAVTRHGAPHAADTTLLLTRLLGFAGWGSWRGAVVAQPSSADRVNWTVMIAKQQLRALPLSFIVTSALGPLRCAALWTTVLSPSAPPAARHMASNDLDSAVAPRLAALIRAANPPLSPFAASASGGAVALGVAAPTRGGLAWERDDVDDVDGDGALLSALQLFIESYTHMLAPPSALDDAQFYKEQHPLSLASVRNVVVMLRSLLRELLCGGIAPAQLPPSRRHLLNSASGLFNSLYARQCRRPFADEAWEWPAGTVKPADLDPSRLSLGGRGPTTSRGSMILAAVPQVLPFSARAQMFMHLLEEDKARNQVRV